jgi:hypothetical protein
VQLNEFEAGIFRERRPRSIHDFVNHYLGASGTGQSKEKEKGEFEDANHGKGAQEHEVAYPANARMQIFEKGGLPRQRPVGDQDLKPKFEIRSPKSETNPELPAKVGEKGNFALSIRAIFDSLRWNEWGPRDLFPCLR